MKFNRDFKPPKLYRGKKEWYVWWEVRNPQTGKMKPFRERGGMNYEKDLRKRTAIANIIIEAVGELWREGKLNPFKPKPKQLTLIEHLNLQHELFISRSQGDQPTMKLKTVHAYNWALKEFVKWLKKNNLESVLPEQFTKKYAYQFWDDTVKEKNRSAFTYNIKRNNVARYFSALLKRDIIAFNPFAGIDALKQTTSRHIPFTDKQMQQIDNLIKEPHFEFWLFTRFIYYLYMRGEEIVKLQLEDINMNLHAVIVYGDKTKTKSQKAPYIPDALYDILQKLNLNQHPQKWYLFSTGLKPGPKQLTRDWITQLFKRWVKEPLKLGKEFTMYAFKHTGIINAHAQGKSIKGIQLQAGHKTEKQTRGYMIRQGLIANDEFADMK